MDLRDVLVPEARLTPLYLLVLIRGLPETSRFVAEKRGGQEFRGWGTDRYATVAIVNAVRALQWTYVAAHSKQRPPTFEPFPLPDDSLKQAKPNSFALVAAAKLAAVRKRKAVVQ